MLKFINQSLKSPNTIGAILPSSRSLAEAMISPIDFAHTKTLVEIGPGTGAITDIIIERMPPHTRYVGVELNHTFHHMLTSQYKNLHFVHGDAKDLSSILRTLEIDRVDAIVCSIPWASLGVRQQLRILNAIRRCIKPGGYFTTFAYLQGMALPSAWMLRTLLRSRFTSVTKTKAIWNNIPPAFAYICHK